MAEIKLRNKENDKLVLSEDDCLCFCYDTNLVSDLAPSPHFTCI